MKSRINEIEEKRKQYRKEHNLPEIKDYGFSKEHNEKSKEIYKFISELDFANGDVFCFKSGGDGDNGECLMDLLDCYFESKKNGEAPYETLMFARPKCKVEKVVDEFELEFTFKDNRTEIYQNKDVRFSFDKKVIRVLLYNGNNKKLKKKIEDYFYKEEWKN